MRWMHLRDIYKVESSIVLLSDVSGRERNSLPGF